MQIPDLTSMLPQMRLWPQTWFAGLSFQYLQPVWITHLAHKVPPGGHNLCFRSHSFSAFSLLSDVVGLQFGPSLNLARAECLGLLVSAAVGGPDADMEISSNVHLKQMLNLGCSLPDASVPKG